MSLLAWMILALLILILAAVILWPIERLRSVDVMQQVHGDQPRLPQ
jgi:hypothetical protein